MEFCRENRSQDPRCRVQRGGSEGHAADERPGRGAVWRVQIEGIFRWTRSVHVQVGPSPFNRQRSSLVFATPPPMFSGRFLLPGKPLLRQFKVIPAPTDALFPTISTLQKLVMSQQCGIW